MHRDNSRGRSQRRGELTRQRLVKATKQLLSQYDYKSVTLELIAAQVGVSKSSILWHFGNKEALLTEAVFDLFDEIDRQITLEKANLPTLSDRVRYLLGAVATYFEANPEAKGIAIALLFDRQVPASVHERISAQWGEHVEAIRRFLSSDTEPVSQARATSIMALMHGLYMQWHLQGCPDGLGNEMLVAYQSLTNDAVADSPAPEQDEETI